MKKSFVSVFNIMIVMVFSGVLHGQNTVGLQYLKPGAVYEGYNLIYPHNQPNVYLLDQCGEIVNIWTDAANFRPGNTAYILPDGKLVKTKRENNILVDSIWAGGGGAIVEILDWGNNLLYSFEQNDSLFRLHHDIAPMPNGNILMIVWEKKTVEEALMAGRRPDLLPGGELWPEAVWEWNPFLDSIVWRWRLWDHLVQEEDDSKDNYGVVGDHPELVDINYDEHNGHEDWLHMNAIDYNPVLDQIVMSVPYFNEMWIIDHSTTMSEAAAHTGGNTGKGGDLIFRWGNPATYDRGDESDKQLYFQHDVSWVNPTATMLDTTFGQISVYNNQAPGGQSPGQVVSTQVMDGSFNYPMTDGVFAPADFSRTVVYPGTDPRSASVSLSSVQFLSNGNTLLLAGRWGFAYEVDTNGELVWEYIVPLKTGSPATQGDTLVINNNLTFRMQRYAADYSAFEGKNMSPKDYLESEPNEGFCALLLPAPEEEPAAFNFRIYPNPTRDVLHIETFDLPTHLHDLSLYDLQGRLIKRIPITGQWTEINLDELPAGVYLLKTQHGSTRKIVVTP